MTTTEDRLAEALRTVVSLQGTVIHQLEEMKQMAAHMTALAHILSDPVNQLEQTPGGYFIYRFDLETMHRIADAIGIPKANADIMPCYTLEELGQLIQPD